MHSTSTRRNCRSSEHHLGEDVAPPAPTESQLRSCAPTSSPAGPSAEEMYKQLLRQERAAWDALFARPASHELRVWRQQNVKANLARTAFLETRPAAWEQPSGEAQRQASTRQTLKRAMEQQKVAWRALEQSMRSASGEPSGLRAAWLDAVRDVHAARQHLHAQTASTTK